jgi:pyruvate/2-oxoglutarate dehydrogenase complex dihydrolipoamide acyltransferase (E2) component
MMPMKMRTLTAIKPHKYGTRHLTAGEEYEVPPRHAIALVAGKKARFADKAAAAKAKVVAEPEPPAAEPEPAAESEPANDIDRLRMQATQLGIDVDRRWGVARLNYEIGRARA